MKMCFYELTVEIIKYKEIYISKELGKENQKYFKKIHSFQIDCNKWNKLFSVLKERQKNTNNKYNMIEENLFKSLFNSLNTIKNDVLPKEKKLDFNILGFPDFITYYMLFNIPYNITLSTVEKDMRILWLDFVKVIETKKLNREKILRKSEEMVTFIIKYL